MPTKRQVAVLGLGRFGSAVARELTRLGHDVLAVDRSERVAQEISEDVTHAVQADVSDGDALRDLGVGEFDTVIVATSSGLETSVLATVWLKRLGVKRIIAKAANEIHGSILEQVGATRVVYPERETGMRLAHSFAAIGVVDYLDVAPGYGVARVPVPDSWIGKSVRELDLARSCGVNIVLIARGSSVIVAPRDEEPLAAGDALILAGLDADLERVPGSIAATRAARD